MRSENFTSSMYIRTLCFSQARAKLFKKLPGRVRALADRVSRLERGLPRVEPLVRDSERHASHLVGQYSELDRFVSLEMDFVTFLLDIKSKSVDRIFNVKSSVSIMEDLA